MTCKYCSNKVVARGMCGLHYQRWRRTNSPEISQQGKRTDVHPAMVRIMAHHTVASNGCWLWDLGINDYGYGRIKVDGQDRLAHRVMWWVHTGQWPKEEIDHSCHTLDKSCPGGVGCLHRRCINPDHLEEVSTVENTRRRDARRQS